MKNNKRTTGWSTAYIITMLIITVVSVVSTFILTQDIWINIGCVAVMAVILVADYFFSLRKAGEISIDFKRATEKAKECISGEGNYFTFMNEPGMFRNKSVNAAFEAYKKELQRIDSKTGQAIKPDISDYFNDEMLSNAIVSELSDQVSGVMTGLGILGTFVGLTLGLGKFNLGADIDTAMMQESISGLLEGIKTAFMTSIFGVVYSLLFNFFYKKICIQTGESMNEFISYYEEKIISSPQNDFLTTFVRSQEMQTEALGRFAEDVATVLAKQMDEVLRPTMEYFNSSIDRFFEKAVYSQNESLDAIVSAFIDNMNQSLGDQLEMLGGTIDKLNNGQMENSNKLNGIVDDIGKNAVNVISINNSLENNVAQMGEVADKIKAYQESIDRANNILLDRIEVIDKYNDKQTEVLVGIKESQSSFNKIAEQIREEIDRHNKIVTDSSSKNEKIYEKLSGTIEAANESINSVITSFGKLNEAFVQEIKDVIVENIKAASATNQEQCNAYTESIKTMIESANRQIIDTGKASEKIITEAFTSIKSIIDSIGEVSGDQSKELAESAKAIAEESRRAIEVCKNALEKQAAATDSVMDEIINRAKDAISMINHSSNEQNQTIVEEFERAIKTSSEILDKQMEEANKISNSMSVNMKSSAKALNDAYKELENDISKVLKTTFESFDSGMADISSHLSGTIKSNEEAIIAMNAYMEEIPQKLYKIIEDMISSLSETIRRVDAIKNDTIQTGQSGKNNNR